MEDLIDIQGLDQISWWPLAWGWWLLIVLLIALVATVSYWLVRTLKYRRSWQYQAHVRLRTMQMQIEQKPLRDLLQHLSVELRKIAMLTTKRETCAGLIGHKWLQWLHEHDPTGFNWQENGTLLISTQYMPDSASIDKNQIRNLINAAQGWVKKC